MSPCPSIAVGPKAGGHHTMRSLSQVFSTSALLLVVQLEEQPRQTSTSLTPDHPKSRVISHRPESVDREPRPLPSPCPTHCPLLSLHQSHWAFICFPNPMHAHPGLLMFSRKSSSPPDHSCCLPSACSSYCLHHSYLLVSSLTSQAYLVPLPNSPPTALYFQLCLSWCPDLTELPTVSIVICTNYSK